MERHGRAGEASEPESHPMREGRDRSKSTSSKNIPGNEIAAVDLSQTEEVPNSGILRVGRGDTCTMYRVGQQIGLGTFSAVYEGVRLLDHKQVAIKFVSEALPRTPLTREMQLIWLQEAGNSSYSHLQAEYRTYRSLKGWNRIPDVVFFGDHGRSRILLTPHQITILEELHDKDFIHRDIKAENFVIQGGTERPNGARAIDFATAKKYRSGNPPTHITYREGRQFTGTARYASINTHRGCEQSRRDDLEALWYMLLYFIRGKLPWQKFKTTSLSEKHGKLREAKQTTTIEELCEGRSGLCAGLRHIRRLGFEEDPDYKYLRDQLVQALNGGIGDIENRQYDWDKLPSPVRLAARSPALPLPPQTTKVTDPSTSFHEKYPTDKRKTLEVIVRATGTWLGHPLFTAKSKQPNEDLIMYDAEAQAVLGEIGKLAKDCIWRLQQPRRDLVRMRARLRSDVAHIVGIPAVDPVEEAVKSLLGLSDQASWDFLVKGGSEKTLELREAFQKVKSLAKRELEGLSSPEIREGDQPITPEDNRGLETWFTTSHC
ncbi:ck1 ck1 ck1-g protein kinase [Verticillium dahliae]